MSNVVARGLGKADPAADNRMVAARQLNRRVEMIVSGDVIEMAGDAGIRDKSRRIRSSAARLRNMRQGPTPSTVWTFFEQS
jgi:hypothetical protein